MAERDHLVAKALLVLPGILDRNACRGVDEIHDEPVALTPYNDIEHFLIERLASEPPVRVLGAVLQLEHGILPVLRHQALQKGPRKVVGSNLVHQPGLVLEQGGHSVPKDVRSTADKFVCK